MAVSDVEAVLEFLRKNGFCEAESALMEDVIEKSELGSFDFQRFVFPMVPPPPPLRIPATRRLSEEKGEELGGGESSSGSSDEFVSLSSEFTNPYGVRSVTRASSQSSSERLSQFGTARDYHDLDMLNDMCWYKENDDDYAMPPCFGSSDLFGGPSEDKFVMTLETQKQSENLLSYNHISQGFQLVERNNYLDGPWPSISSDDVKDEVEVLDCCNLRGSARLEGATEKENDGYAVYNCSSSPCVCCGEPPAVYSLTNMQGTDTNDICDKVIGDKPTEYVSGLEHESSSSSIYFVQKSSTSDQVKDFKGTSDLHTLMGEKDIHHNGSADYQAGDDSELGRGSHEHAAAADEQGDNTSDELWIYNNNEDEYEVFDLRIIHRRNRTGFEENKDLPIVINSIIASRYCVTEYLGSAAFSKVIQAHDLQTGVDVCLKIIKNDKDFFDQSLDEIKLLKLVNKHDPGDERHILRLYDYFYFQEHLFIVCELLQANLYEFQKYNRESGGEPYFTLNRLQFITRQCLEALEYLHGLGIIHCDLKPENILIKSYRRCEIKVIDLGSSCFQSDNLCLYVQSRSYRAPEVMLGLPYDQKIDLWSLGCILAELSSGEVLFPNDAIVLLLARMIAMLGPIDSEMLVRGQETQKYFTREYDLYQIDEETNQLEYIVPEESSLERQLQVSDVGFIDFITGLLEINPQRRPTAREALEHPWLSYSYELDPA
ncbi:hypothetical protein RJ639_046241 [Escallonia herrerae]|uniref:Protein kinase domain-containing protein n=1 Tax=Escallonia herrerae TaxID=1293975 RepID=A0AA88W6W9_9ASTE|nr:hypothetical protein RJ639_046241 [Escallonia herrerae]